MIRRTSLLIATLAFLMSSAAFASQAGLVIDLGGGNVTTQCVTFEGPVTTAFELLQTSGVTFTADTSSNFGAAICSIDSTGCQFPAESCFCQCTSTTPTCNFFTLAHFRNGEYVVSHVGSSHFIVRNGSVILFAFGDGTITTQVFTFEDICGT